MASKAGTCKSYTKGDANLVLCVANVTEINPQLVQVGGYLLNNGTVKACGIKLRHVNASQVYDFWPDWATSSSYEVDFQPQQVTAVGLSMPPNKDGLAPGIELVSFKECDDAEAANATVTVREFNITEAKVESPKVANKLSRFAPRDLAWRFQAGAPAAQSPAQAAGGVETAADPNSLVFTANGPAPAGLCKEHYKGDADLILCVQNVTSIPGNKVLLQGFLYNNGAEACDVKIRPTNVHGKVFDFWPDWAMASAYEQYFNKEQFSTVGLTAEKNADGSMPNIELYSFRDCQADTKTAATGAKVVDVPLANVRVPKPEEEAQEAMEYGDAVDVAADGSLLDDSFVHRRAQEVYTNVPVINPDYQFCRAFKGADNVSEVTICLDNAKAWRDRRRGRIVQTNLVLLNSGTVGVCNITVQIENLDKEVGDHYPQLINDEGFDTFPNFTQYYAPGRLTNFGASIPKDAGVPHVYIPPTFAPCPEDNTERKRKFKCSESTRSADTKVKICVYTDLKEWKELDGSRTVAVEGFVSNTGSTPLCNVTVNIQEFANAKAFWGDWMPTFPKLQSGSSVKWGANIPFEEGWPRVSLSKYSICPKEVAPPKTAAPVDAPAEEVPAAPAAPAAPAEAAPAAGGNKLRGQK